MKGRSLTYGAISIVNAIPSGTGVTLGVDLKTSCSVELKEEPGEFQVTVNGVPTDKSLALATVKEVFKEIGLSAGSYSGRIDTITEIPMGTGLKSSSSSSTAIALALCSALGIKVDFKKILKWSSRASLEAKKSLTGAMDDAAACIYGGINVVDNINGRVILSKSFPESFRILVNVPNEKSKRNEMDVKSMHYFANVMDSITRLAIAGDVWNCLTINGLLVSTLMGYSNEIALNAIRKGALAAGVSGTGPAVVAIFPENSEQSITTLLDDWEKRGSMVISTKVNNKKASVIHVE
jgi:shikimate kinase